MEHRRNPRVTRNLPVGLSSVGLPFGTFATRDLSVDGLFLQCGPIALQPGDPVMLHVETSLPGIPMMGQVVRRTEVGIAVRLTHRHLHYAHDVLVALAKDGRVFPQVERPTPAAARRKPSPFRPPPGTSGP